MRAARAARASAAVAAVAAAVAATAASCGMLTHNMINRKALRWWAAAGHTPLREIIERHQDAYQAGAPGPDWGYATGRSDESEEMHWLPFFRVAAEYIGDTYGSDPAGWDAETEKLVAFLFGAMGHSVGDLAWHALKGQSQGFMRIMGQQEGGDAHTVADTGGEFLASSQFDQEYILREWYVPADDIVEIYRRIFPDTDLTAEEFALKSKILFVGATAGRLGGWLLVPYSFAMSNFLAEQFLPYFSGGIDDLAVWTPECFDTLSSWIASGVNDDWCAIQGDGTRTADEHRLLHDLEFLAALAKMSDAGTVPIETTRTARGFYFSVPDSYDGNPWADLYPDAADPDADRPRECPAPEELDGTDVFHSTEEDEYMGSAVTAGDLDGDGRDELVVGGPGFSRAGAPQTGRVHVYASGSGEPVQVLDGPGAYTRFGAAVALLDVDGDGALDLAVSAPTTGGMDLDWRGAVYVHFGFGDGTFAAEPDRVFEGDVYTANLGLVLAVGDLDGDGRADLAIGAPHWHDAAAPDVEQPGTVFVALSGSGFGELVQVGWGAHNAAWFGQSLGIAGGLLFVGEPMFDDAEAGKDVGRVHGLRLEGNGTVVPVFALAGVDEFEQLGASFCVGAPFGDGRAHLVVASPTGALDTAMLKPGLVRAIPMDALAGDVTVKDVPVESLLASDRPYGRFGHALVCSDLTGDGIDDVAITEPDRGRSAGLAYIFAGGATFPRGTAQNPVGDAHECIQAPAIQARLGVALVAADFDGDGHAEIGVAAHRSSVGAPVAGGVYVVEVAV